MWQLKDDKLRPVAYASRCLTETEKRYAQIEKEALAVPWACEKFRPFILGLHFRLETDHRPLVRLLGNKSIDQLSPRLQRFRMRLMWFDYDIAYVQGKNLTTADALSRSPTTRKDVQDQLSREAERLINMIIETASISNVKLQHIRETVQNDNVCKTVLNYCKSGWPKVTKLSKDLLPFYNLRNDLSVQNGLLLKREAIIIPEMLRKNILEKIHEGHQGVNKCRDRAKDIVWWPGISRDIGNWVKYCAVCCKDLMLASQ